MKEEIIVVFGQDMELCYDGVNPRKYEAGKPYQATHAHEKKMFEAFLADGRASLPSQKKTVEESVEKVVVPKQTKKRKNK